MKRSGFLRSLSALISAPLLLSEIDAPKIQEAVKEVALPIKHTDERLRVGDIVMFKNRQVARVQSVVMGNPTFKSVDGKELTDTSAYTLFGQPCQL